MNKARNCNTYFCFDELDECVLSTKASKSSFFWSLDKLSSQTAKSSLNDFVTASLNLFLSFSSLIKKTGITLLHCKTKETSMT